MMEPGSTILFRRAPAVAARAELRQFATCLRNEVAAGRSFTCLITDDRELRRLNREFLGCDYATDVLSFPSGAPTGPIGDIAISAERAREQAAGFGHSIGDEIRILMLHGVLHLSGMDHESDRGRMRRAESSWRKKLGLPAGLIERTRR
ncbi:MAG: rRNA maturation RNase YbeY [Acidobacteria bacterium]|nr:rRNA maturation RNase YbeY [Acidobacteriota bacterium]